MKNILTLTLLLLCVLNTAAMAQNSTSNTTKTATKQGAKRGPIFRATKEQINQAQTILKESLDGFVNSDVELAAKVILNDKILDDLYEQILRELLTYMFEDPRSISRAIKLMFIAKALERVGDHSANIAEMVVFLVKGQDIRHGTRIDRR